MTLAMTLQDYRKRTAPDGSLDFIVETLNLSNPILQDMKFMEGNLPTGIQTTLRNSIPTPSIRKINKGVAATKSTTEQIVDTCTLLEARSMVDVKLLEMQKDKEAFRKSEDAAHVEGFGQTVANYLFYGDVKKNPDEFNGFDVRYKVIGGDKNSAGYQSVDAGGTGTGNVFTSAWLVGWGERATCGIYPRNTYAGLKMRDLGEADVLDAEGNPFRAVQTLFNWNVGLTVRDIRSNAVLRNIKTTELDSSNLVEKMIIAKNRIRNLDLGSIKYVWYVPNCVYTALETHLINSSNIHVTRQDFMGAMPTLYLAGIPVRKVDAILENEARIG